MRDRQAGEYASGLGAGATPAFARICTPRGLERSTEAYYSSLSVAKAISQMLSREDSASTVAHSPEWSDVSIRVGNGASIPLSDYKLIRKVNAFCAFLGLFGILFTQATLTYGRAFSLCALVTFLCWQAGFALHRKNRRDRWRQPAANGRHRALRCQESTSARVVISGDPETVNYLRSCNLEFGDPEIFGHRPFVPSWGASMLLFSPLIINAAFFEQITPLSYVFVGHGRTVVWVICALLGSLLMWQVLSPTHGVQTYYRVLPGRVDNMIALPLSSKTHTKRKIELWERRIRCTGAILTILTLLHKTPFEQVEIDLRTIDRPSEFVRAIISAATTRRGQPSMPNDELLG